MKTLRKLTAAAMSLLLLLPSLLLPLQASAEDDAETGYQVLADFKYTGLGSGVEKGPGTGYYFEAESKNLTEYAEQMAAKNVYLQMDINATYKASNSNGSVLLQPRSGAQTDNKLLNVSASNKEKAAMDKMAGKWYTVSTLFDGSTLNNLDLSDITHMTYFVMQANTSIQVQNLRIVYMTGDYIRSQLEALVETPLEKEEDAYASLAGYAEALADAQTALANAGTSDIDLLTAWSRLQGEISALVDLSEINTTYYAGYYPFADGANGNAVITDGVLAYNGAFGRYNSPRVKADNHLTEHANTSLLRYEIDVMFDEDPGEAFQDFYLQPIAKDGSVVANMNTGVGSQLNALHDQTGVWHTISAPIPDSVRARLDAIAGFGFHVYPKENAAEFHMQFKDMRIVDGFDDDIRAELKAAAEENPEGDFTADTLADFQTAQAAGLAALEDKTADYGTYRDALQAIADAKNALIDVTYMVAAFAPPAAADENGVYTWNITASSTGNGVFNATPAFTLDEAVDLSRHDSSKLRFRVEMRLVSGDVSKLTSLSFQLQNGSGTISNNTADQYRTQLTSEEWLTVDCAIPADWTITKSVQLYLYNTADPVVLEVKNMRIVDITVEVAVTFIGKYNETVAVKTASSAAELADILQNTTATALGGYKFIGWDQDSTNAAQLFDAAVASGAGISVTAVYAQEVTDKDFHLTIGAGVTAKDGLNNAVNGSTDLGFDQRITVTAGGDVAYWVLDGAKVGFGKNTYTFYVSGDNSVAAVLTTDAETVVPAVVLQKATYGAGSENYTLTAIAQTSIPAENTVSEYGVIFTSKVPTTAFLSDSTNAVVKVKSSKTGANQQYMAHLLNVKSGKTRYARAYAIVDGETIYSTTAVQFKTTASDVTTEFRVVA